MSRDTLGHVPPSERGEESFTVGDRVRWTKEAIEVARNGKDSLDRALVIEGSVYEVVSVRKGQVMIVKDGDEETTAFPANVNSLEKA